MILALIGVAYLLIGLYTLFRDRQRRAWLFYLWCLASAALYLITPGRLGLSTGPADLVHKALYLGDELARALLPPLTLHLFLVFPSLLGDRRRLRRWIPFLYLPAAVLLTLQAELLAGAGASLGRGAVAFSIQLLDRLEGLHLVLYAVAAVAVLVVRLARHRDWEQARQVRWIALGMAAGYLPFAGLYLIPNALGVTWPELVNVAAVLPLALVPLTFSYAILRYKLWDIEIIVRNAISYTLTLLLGLIGFSLINLAISRGLPTAEAGTRVVLSFVGGLAIAGLLVPARRGIAGGLERIQYRGSFGKRRSLAASARDLLHERNLDRLSTRLIERIEDAVGVGRANLYLAQPGGLEPVRRAPGLPAPLPFNAFGDDLWGREFLRLSGVVLPGGAETPAQRLYVAGYRYAFPLAVRGKGVGLALTSYKRDQDPLNSDDLELIRQFLDQAALAIENAQLLDRVQQQLEEVHRLQQYTEGIIDSSPAGIAVLDAADRIVSANTAFAELVSVDLKRLPGEPIETVLPVRPLPAPGEPLLEASFCVAGGREHHLQLSTALFRRGPGEPLRILVVNDVSERVAMESAMKQKDRLAALGVLAAAVAHEVNTPITGISSYAQMLIAETPEADPRHAVLKKVERQTFRAARIVNSLLEFARDREGEMAPVELAALVDDSLDLVKERLSSRRVRVDWRPDDTGITVQGIAGELQQVVTNLLLNAGDAMADQGGEVTLRLTAADGRARLTVADTGSGIGPELREKIFEPFYTTKSGEGTGLGLSISHEIVRRHGGEMGVESEPGRGSCFTVELPLALRSEAAG